MKGWMGRVLRVDLTSGHIETEELDQGLARAYLGGRGLGARLLYDEVGPEVGPLEERNLLVFATGPLTGTPAPTGGRFSVSTKSPLTGTILDSNSGGRLGVRLKRAGYDALIVSGRAEEPVYLEVDERGAQVRPASELWGLTVSQTSARLSAPGASLACIGPAGENMVRFACVINDRGRALGRGGVGAVMGGKRLKAILVRGQGWPAIADAQLLDFVVYEAQKQLKSNPVTSQALPQFGTAVIVNIMNEAGAFPTRNFTASQFEAADAISGEALRKEIFVRRAACWGCPIACGRITRTAHQEGEGPEYETLWALGAQCGIGELAAIAEANYLANDLGLDTISLGGTLACAMELAERGLLDCELRFGQASALTQAITDIAHRRGLGDELAEGALHLATRYGAPELAMQAKGLELPAYDPRAMQGQGLGFATSNRGGCHLRANMLGPEILGLPKMVDRFAVRGKAGIVIVHQNLSAALDSLGVCKFSANALSEEYYARMLSAVSGIEFEPQELMTIGERIWNLERLYNLREGFTRADDTLPRRLLEEPVAEGPAKGRVVELETMLEEYYRFRGWDEEGRPTRWKLDALGLEDCL